MHHPDNGLFLKLPLLMVGLSVGIGFILAHIGYWAALARKHRTNQRPVEGITYRKQGGRAGWLAIYGNCWSVTLTTKGIYVSPHWMFRAFHPPLLLPWILLQRVEQKRLLGFRWLLVRCADPGGPWIEITLPKQALQKMQTISGRADLLAVSVR